jgi:hypothetical protein
VLDRIQKHQLFSEESLKKQSKNSRKLALRLLDFISKRIQVQDYNKFDRPTDTSHVGIISSLSPPPPSPFSPAGFIEEKLVTSRFYVKSDPDARLQQV